MTATQQMLSARMCINMQIQLQEAKSAVQQLQQGHATDAQTILTLQADLAIHRQHSAALEHELRADVDRLQQKASTVRVCA